MSAATADVVTLRHGETLLVCGPNGPMIRNERDAVDIVGATYGHQVSKVVIPVGRLDPQFFTLSSRIAGDVIQKFVNYRLHLVIIGDISQELAASSAFRAFVHESNRGSHVWFLRDLAELDERLAARVTARRTE